MLARLLRLLLGWVPDDLFDVDLGDGAHDCPTPCDDDCEAKCHEAHLPPWKRGQ